MSDTASVANLNSLTGLLLPLADRTLLVPNVAIAELIAYQNVYKVANSPNWFIGQIAWRDLRLPLMSFEAACGDLTATSTNARVVVINALGGRPKVRFIALLVQGIPRAAKIGPELDYADVALSPLEMAAVEVAGQVVKIPDLMALEQKLADAGLI